RLRSAPECRGRPAPGGSVRRLKPRGDELVTDFVHPSATLIVKRQSPFCLLIAPRRQTSRAFRRFNRWRHPRYRRHGTPRRVAPVQKGTDPVIRAVLVTPLSGPLGAFGRAGATALSLWARHAGVDIDVYDAYPSTA